ELSRVSCLLPPQKPTRHISRASILANNKLGLTNEANMVGRGRPMQVALVARNIHLYYKQPGPGEKEVWGAADIEELVFTAVERFRSTPIPGRIWHMDINHARPRDVKNIVESVDCDLVGSVYRHHLLARKCGFLMTLDSWAFPHRTLTSLLSINPSTLSQVM
ncbi:hypothetical protein M427DRAFT_495026, partial [Gonapodya prolifera JEL478]